MTPPWRTCGASGLLWILLAGASSQAAALKAVQNRLATIGNGSTNTLVTIDPVDTAKAFLVFGVSGRSVNP